MTDREEKGEIWERGERVKRRKGMVKIERNRSEIVWETERGQTMRVTTGGHGVEHRTERERDRRTPNQYTLGTRPTT